MAKIMVVDDAAFARTMLKNVLEQLGHEVIAEAHDGVEAVKLYSRTRPDLVTMDITMPELDGVSAASKILESYSDAKIIMCSAVGQRNRVIEAIHAGAKDFIVKPFHIDRVNEAIKHVLRA
ncbi:response regulator [Paenibacillus thalictri]|uniref:Response regulator n=1 Tax=Paenibacillus thalictri TaxID=2527873 RepID=A0A4Q9DL63_9BACL|nr:response regulator [Paenibacillus thalictri]TBL74007.1 response regulator [Paenibacillus thalictri]